MSERFNKMSFEEKIKVLIDNSDILQVGNDGNHYNIQVVDREIQEELDDLDEVFYIENELSDRHIVSLMMILGIKVTDA